MNRLWNVVYWSIDEFMYWPMPNRLLRLYRRFAPSGAPSCAFCTKRAKLYGEVQDIAPDNVL